MKQRICFLALAFMVVMPAWGQKHYTEIEFPALPDFVIPEAERVELDNGMILFLIEDHQLPLVRASARIGGGSVHESADKVGLASVTGTVMRTGGTTSMNGDEINTVLENMAASVESFVGSTSGSVTMSALSEHADEVLDIFADVLRHPAFPEDKIELAVTQEKSGVSRRNDNAQSIAFREFDELLYGSDHPLARSAEYATLDAIGREDLVAFHHRFFHPNNVILGIWGDFDTAAMKERLSTLFGDWSKADDFVRPMTAESPSLGAYGVNLISKEDVTQSTILLGHMGELMLDHPDFSAVRVMNQVLSGGFSSRLFQNVRDDQGLAYSVFGSYNGTYDRIGNFYAGVMTKSASTVEATRSVLHEIEKMREAPPTEEEMVQAKDSYLNSFVFRFDTRPEIVGRMMTYEYYDYPKDFLDQVKSGIEAVTAKDVHRVSEQYLKPDQVQILVVGNSNDFGEPLSVLGEVATIDIAIPTEEDLLPEATAETMNQGRSLLQGALGALGGQAAFDAIETVQVHAVQTMMTPDNMEVNITTDVTYVYPDKIHLVQTLPMGEIAITKNGQEYTFPDMVPEQAYSALKREVGSSIWRDVTYLFAHLDQVDAQHIGQEEVDGKQLEVVQVTPPDAEGFRIQVDPETMMPVALLYTSAAIGPPTPVREVLSDYREVEGGIMLPFGSMTYSQDEHTASLAVETIEINAEVDAGLFE